MRAIAAGCLLAAASLPLLPNRFEAHCPRVRHAPRAAILQDVAPPPAFVEALDAERAAEIWLNEQMENLITICTPTEKRAVPSILLLRDPSLFFLLARRSQQVAGSLRLAAPGRR